MKIFKILAGAFMLCMFLYYTAGIYFFYHIQQTALHKAHAAEKLKENKSKELKELRIAFQEITWKDAHEFYFDGKLYDLVSYTRSNDSLFCVVYHDAQEQGLNESYTAFVGGEQKQTKQNQQEFKLYPKFLSEQKNIFVYNSYQFNREQNTTGEIIQVYILLHSPPPEV